MSTDEFWGRELYYIDGITKVTDPFWKSVCRKCGHTYLACLSTTECPQCGGMDVDRWLGGKMFAVQAEGPIWSLVTFS